MKLVLAISGVLGLAVVSLFIGVSDVSPSTLIAGGDAAQVLLISRIPRTVAVLLSGMAVGVAGMIMQMLARNRFVEPSTTGTVEAASLGLLAVAVLAPATPVLGKMAVASLFALGGTALFLALISRVRLSSSLVVPLIGIMLGGVIGAITTFFAYRFDLLQSLGAWMLGDFSGVLRGRYELLFIVAGLTMVAYVAADRFTVAGMGQDVSVTLGLNYRGVIALGMTIVSLISAVVVVTVGAIPFLGLVVPNVVSLIFGDALRRAVPWVAVLGAGFVLVCDMVGRVIRFPYEIPIGVVVGVVGAAVFLHLLLRRRAHAA